MKKKYYWALAFAIFGVTVLVISIAGSAYAYYSASATSNNVTGTAGGGNEPTLTVSKITTDTTNLIPIDADTTTLTNAASAATKCKDTNNYTVCQIYSVTVKNNTSVATNFNIGLTALSGNNTPNIDAVAMGTSNSAVTSATSIKGNASGIASNVSVSGNTTSSTYYFMVFVKNLTSSQTDAGLFSGTVTAVSTNGAEIKAQF